MKTWVFLFVLIPSYSFAEIEFRSVTAADGYEIQACARFPDAVKFPGPRPALMFIQGSGLYDSCLRLNGPLAGEIAKKGVILFYRQKRGIRVDEADLTVKIDKQVYAENTITSLEADSIAAFQSLKSDPRVNPKRISVVGGSEGTWMATAIAEQNLDIHEIGLIGAPIERFDALFSRQVSLLVPSEVTSALDKDKSDDLSKIELDPAYLRDHGLLSFEEIDADANGKIDRAELGAEMQRALLFSWAHNDNTFLMSDFWSGGVSLNWLGSAIRAPELGPRILNLKMPVYLYHGREDLNALVHPVYALEQESMAKGLEKIKFQYFDGLGHSLSREAIYKILFTVADNLNRP